MWEVKRWFREVMVGGGGGDAAEVGGHNCYISKFANHFFR